MGSTSRHETLRAITAPICVCQLLPPSCVTKHKSVVQRCVTKHSLAPRILLFLTPKCLDWLGSSRGGCGLVQLCLHRPWTKDNAKHAQLWASSSTEASSARHTQLRPLRSRPNIWSPASEAVTKTPSQVFAQQSFNRPYCLVGWFWRMIETIHGKYFLAHTWE